MPLSLPFPFARRADLPSGAALYAAIVAEARRPGWYRSAQVPDTIDGRFAVLATLLALTDIRLGRGDMEARERAPRLAECFIADMDAQMREAGFGDPSLGKQVRMMMGSLAGRVERWQDVIGQGAAWNEAVRHNVYRDSRPEAAAMKAGEAMVRDWWRRLEAAGDAELVEGRIG